MNEPTELHQVVEVGVINANRTVCELLLHQGAMECGICVKDRNNVRESIELSKLASGLAAGVGGVERNSVFDEERDYVHKPSHCCHVERCLGFKLYCKSRFRIGSTFRYLPTFVVIQTSAPAARSICTACVCPRDAAVRSGVSPSQSLVSTRAPY